MTPAPVLRDIAGVPILVGATVAWSALSKNKASLRFGRVIDLRNHSHGVNVRVRTDTDSGGCGGWKKPWKVAVLVPQDREHVCATS